MEILQLTRKEMSQLLFCLQGERDDTPLAILQRAWSNTHRQDIRSGKSFSAFIATSLPPILEKMIKLDKREPGLSLNEIVALGNQIEHTHFSVTSVQNWVKREIKEWIGRPKLGKKYSIEQAAMLFLVEDLRATLDFESIRKLFTLIFRNPDNDDDDLISPIHLYAAYSSIFEELDPNNDHVVDAEDGQSGANMHVPMMDMRIQEKAKSYVQQFVHLHAEEQEAIANTIVIAILSVQAAYFQKLSRQYLNAALFLRSLGPA